MRFTDKEFKQEKENYVKHIFCIINALKKEINQLEPGEEGEIHYIETMITPFSTYSLRYVLSDIRRFFALQRIVVHVDEYEKVGDSFLVRLAIS